MLKKTKRALCAKRKAAYSRPVGWLGFIKTRSIHGREIEQCKMFPNYWACKGYVDMQVLHAYDYQFDVIDSGVLACFRNPVECWGL